MLSRTHFPAHSESITINFNETKQSASSKIRKPKGTEEKEKKKPELSQIPLAASALTHVFLLMPGKWYCNLYLTDRAVYVWIMQKVKTISKVNNTRIHRNTSNLF